MPDLARLDATSGREGRRLEVLTGGERRRSYTDTQEARLVAETLQPGGSAADVARRHELHPQQLYTWCRHARPGRLALPAEAVALFAEVVTDGEAGAARELSEQGGAPAAAEIVIELGEVRLRVGAGAPAERAAALVSALRGTQ